MNTCAWKWFSFEKFRKYPQFHQELSNEYLLFTRKIGVDTAENESLKVWS